MRTAKLRHKINMSKQHPDPEALRQLEEMRNEMNLQASLSNQSINQKCTIREDKHRTWKGNVYHSRYIVPQDIPSYTSVKIAVPHTYAKSKQSEKDITSYNARVLAKEEENHTHLPPTTPVHWLPVEPFQPSENHNEVSNEEVRYRSYTREDSFAKLPMVTGTKVYTDLNGMGGLTSQDLEATWNVLHDCHEQLIEWTPNPAMHTRMEGTINKRYLARQCRILRELKRNPPPPPPIPHPIPTEIGLVTHNGKKKLNKTKCNHRSHPWDSPPDLRYGYRNRSSSQFMMTDPVSPLRDQSDVMAFFEEPLAAAAKLLISDLHVPYRSLKDSNGSYD